MSLRVLLFARFADLLGASELLLDLPAGVTVGEVLEAVRALPGGAAIPSAALVAVNFEQADSTTVVRVGDEVALLPPVAGG
jgi:molybdopterin converting factor subunit 1